jgi:hypothetical protein
MDFTLNLSDKELDAVMFALQNVAMPSIITNPIVQKLLAQANNQSKGEETK